MNRRQFRVFVPGLLLLAGLAGGCQKEDASRFGSQEQEAFTGEPTTVVATVDDSPILLREVDQIANMMKSSGMPDMNDLSPRELQRRALDNLIERQLLVAAAREAGNFPTDEEMEQASRDIRGRFPTDEAFQVAVGQQGLTEEEFDARMTEDMAVRRYLSIAVPDTVPVGPEDARTFYDEHPDLFEVGERLRASHILVATSQMDPEPARAKADSLLAEIRNGAVFEDIARVNSDCPSAQRGGSLNEFGRGEMVPPFEEAAYKLEPGEISDVVETRFGYHIIRLEERIPSRTIPFEEVEDRIAQQVRADRHTGRLQNQIEELRSKASIERKL